MFDLTIQSTGLMDILVPTKLCDSKPLSLLL
jgi:hypothetical protein